MKAFLKAFLLRIPAVRDYVSQVRRRHEAAEREISRLTGEQAALEHEMQIKLLHAASERNGLVADLKAMQGTRENLASMLSASRERISAVERERDAQAFQCLFHLLLDRQPLEKEREKYCAELAAGTSYEVLACKILLSPEGRKNPRNRERFATIYNRQFPFPISILPESETFPIKIVDVGAQLLEMMDHVYAPLLHGRRCKVVGFEPLQDEAARRSAQEAETEISYRFHW